MNTTQRWVRFNSHPILASAETWAGSSKTAGQGRAAAFGTSLQFSLTPCDSTTTTFSALAHKKPKEKEAQKEEMGIGQVAQSLHTPEKCK